MQLDFSEFYIMVYNLLFYSLPVRHLQVNGGLLPRQPKECNHHVPIVCHDQ